MKKKIFFILILFCSTNALAVTFQGKFIQGHFIIGKTEFDTKVLIDKKEVKVTDDGYFVLAVPNHCAVERKFYKEEWAPYDAPRHLYHFDSVSLQKILELNN